MKWKDEAPGLSCSNGKCHLPLLYSPLEPFYNLLKIEKPISEHFISNIRKYISCFQMTSFGTKEVNKGNFMATVKVQSQVYNLIASFFFCHRAARSHFSNFILLMMKSVNIISVVITHRKVAELTAVSNACPLYSCGWKGGLEALVVPCKI